LSGFSGGTFDGRYVYLVPHFDTAPDGHVARFDTHEPDGGHDDGGHPADGGKDAGDSDASPDNGIADPTLWSTFDIATVNPIALGFLGAVFDGNFIYFVPNSNGAYNNQVRNGGSATLARLQVDAGFSSASAWSTFDVSKVNGLAQGFWGGAFDGRHVYFVPRGTGIVARFDTNANKLDSLAAWSAYDVTRVITTVDAAMVQYQGAAYDGRFVYFIPAGTAYGTVLRYDTKSNFTADCAWSTVDLYQDGGALGPQNFDGAVFDGKYLYLIPATNGVVARFLVKTPPSMPKLPAFSGSFL
jgi:hypothetical protein